MGYIARAQLASAVSNAGRARDHRDVVGPARPGARRDPQDARPHRQAVRGQHRPDVRPRPATSSTSCTTRACASSPRRPATRRCFTDVLHDAGITVFHVVPHLRGALKAVAAGVDGLVVEGGEGGGFKSPRDVATMVLLPLVCSKVDVPVIARGRHRRRAVDGGRVRARRRGRADGHAHALVGGVAGARQLEAAGARRRRDRHRVPEPLRQAGFRVLATPLSEALERATSG